MVERCADIAATACDRAPARPGFPVLTWRVLARAPPVRGAGAAVCGDRRPKAGERPSGDGMWQQ